MLDVSVFKHFRINHSELFADKQNHINGIENFWNQATRHMRKFNGVPRAQFGLYFKKASDDLTTVTQWINYPKSKNGLTVTSDSYLGQTFIFIKTLT